MDRCPLNILHIGKTGGNSLRTALLPYVDKCSLIIHGHEITLQNIPSGQKVLFVVRDPVERFVSGFNSRLRRGLPLNLAEWTQGERIAFARFGTPNDLAAALGSENLVEQAAARAAMSEIYHPSRALSFWLHSSDYVLKRRADIVFIASTEHLNSDFECIKRLLDLPRAARLPEDEIGRHATPAGFQTCLSEEAASNLRQWYYPDYTIFAACTLLRSELLLAGKLH